MLFGQQSSDMPRGSMWITWRRITFVVPALGSATAPEANSNRFNSCSVTPQSKRRNGTSDADRSSKMRSTIGSKYPWEAGRDNPVIVADPASLSISSEPPSRESALAHYLAKLA